jgi:hypothetical protein
MIDAVADFALMAPLMVLCRSDSEPSRRVRPRGDRAMTIQCARLHAVVSADVHERINSARSSVDPSADGH